MANDDRRNNKGNTDQAWYTRDVNPYTFIPLGKGRKKSLADLDKEDGLLLSGVISCSLEAKSDLCVPDAKNSDGKYPFFSVDGVRTIPGSSIRGVIRSVYETLTDSCLRANTTRFHGRSSKPKNPGILERNADDSYTLYESERLRVMDLTAVSGWETGRECRVNAKDPTGKNPCREAEIDDKNGDYQGIFLRPNCFAEKSKPSVFTIGGKPKATFSSDDSCIAALGDNIALYDIDQSSGNHQQKAVGKAYKELFEQMKERKAKLPVWYQVRNGKYEFAPSQISRTVFDLTPQSYLGKEEDKDNLLPCDSEVCCPACRLFGFVSNKAARASLVRFGDAKMVPKSSDSDFYFDTMPVLMEPRSSSFEFYLHNDEKRFSFGPWTKGTTLSGRKVYWHHPRGYKRQGFHSGNNLNLRSTVEMAPKGTTFKFDVFFDGITKDQLNELVYVLTFGGYWDKGDGQYCHKIGRGKPVGAGSALISVDKVAVRSFDKETGSYGVDTKYAWKQDLPCVEGRLSHLSEVQKVAHLQTVKSGVSVAYPQYNNAIFKWFIKNRGKISTAGEQPYNEVLRNDGEPGYWNKSGDAAPRPAQQPTARQAQRPAHRPVQVAGDAGRPVVGEVYDGKVTGVKEYGVFVEFAGKTRGLAFRTNIPLEHEDDFVDYYQRGDAVRVKVTKETEKGWQLKIL